MVVKINSKPIQVMEEEEKERIDWLYLSVTIVGYGLIAWVVDYMCFSFFYVHPLPFISKMGGVVTWIMSFL
jgi:hypothetical protein